MSRTENKGRASAKLLDYIASFPYKRGPIHIFGEAGAGKSTLVYMLLKYFSKEGNGVLFIDTENKFSGLRFENVAPGNLRRSGKRPNILVARARKMEDLVRILNGLEFNILNGLMERPAVLAIDTVSSPLRLFLKTKGFGLYSESVQFIFERIVIPVLLLEQKGTKIILVHQCTTDPDGKLRPFLYKIFTKYGGLWITMKKIGNNGGIMIPNGGEPADFIPPDLPGNTIFYKITSEGLKYCSPDKISSL